MSSATCATQYPKYLSEGSIKTLDDLKVATKHGYSSIKDIPPEMRLVNSVLYENMHRLQSVLPTKALSEKIHSTDIADGELKSLLESVVSADATARFEAVEELKRKYGWLHSLEFPDGSGYAMSKEIDMYRAGIGDSEHDALCRVAESLRDLMRKHASITNRLLWTSDCCGLERNLAETAARNVSISKSHRLFFGVSQPVGQFEDLRILVCACRGDILNITVPDSPCSGIGYRYGLTAKPVSQYMLYTQEQDTYANYMMVEDRESGNCIIVKKQ